MIMMMVMIIANKQNDDNDIRGNSKNKNNNIDSERFSSRVFTISLHHELSLIYNTLKWPGRSRVQVKCKTSGAFHIQRVVYRVVQRDSSAFKFDRVRVAFIFF